MSLSSASQGLLLALPGPAFYIGSGSLNSGPNACGALSTQPSPSLNNNYAIAMVTN